MAQAQDAAAVEQLTKIAAEQLYDFPPAALRELGVNWRFLQAGRAGGTLTFEVVTDRREPRWTPTVSRNGAPDEERPR